MTSRDTYDIEQYEKETIQSINVQPKMLVELIMNSEPIFFDGKHKPAVIPHQISPEIIKIYAMMLAITKWHAQLQVEFDKELLEEK